MNENNSIHQVVAFTLHSMGHLGCFPECVVVDTDEKGIFSTQSVKITTQNKNNYKHLFDKTDEQLFLICTKLEKESIVSKVNEKKTDSWDKLRQKYLDGKNLPRELQYIKDYLIEYIETNQNAFFDLISDKPLYLPQGKFPFTWIKINIEQELPELLYCFDIRAGEINYSLNISCRKKQIDLSGGLLLSRKRARVLLKNKIFEFEEEVDGSKLIPFSCACW